jgi:hypothetical protein
VNRVDQSTITETVTETVGILAILVNVYLAWDSKASRLKITFSVVAALLAIAAVIVGNSSQLAKLLSKPPNVQIIYQLIDHPGHLPNCRMFGLIVGGQPLKKLDLVIHFTEPIHDSRLVVGNHTFADFGDNPGISVQAGATAPCEVLTSAAPAQNDAIKFTVTSDRKEIIVSGRDLSEVDSRMFFGTFYPIDDASRTGRHIDIIGRATYEGFAGKEVDAPIIAIDGVSGKSRALSPSK